MKWDCSIIEAVKDQALFRPGFGDDLSTWQPWLTAMRVLYGMPVKNSDNRKLIRQCTGRNPDLMPKNGFDTALFLTGRRSGKSRMAATVGAFTAVLSGLHTKLTPGETGLVPVVCPTKQQGRIVSGYLRAMCNATPILRSAIKSDLKDKFEFTNGVVVEVLGGDYRHVRGYTLLAAVVDEIAFFGIAEDQKLKNDTELINALKPGLASMQGLGKLICIGSPYARKGWCWEQYRKHFANDREANTLVWNAPSKRMNPTLSQKVIDDALREDYASARAEYLGEFRDDVGLFLPRHVIEELVVKDRFENLPREDFRYVAFADVGGGRSDGSALAIAHQEGRKVVIDFAKLWKAPNNPHYVIGAMAAELRRFHILRVTGDAYGAEFVAGGFNAQGIRYAKHPTSTSGIYAELLPIISAKEIELLDDKMLVDQLASLERRTRSGAKDSIDHPPNGHDDLANAVAGAAICACQRKVFVGAGGF